MLNLSLGLSRRSSAAIIDLSHLNVGDDEGFLRLDFNIAGYEIPVDTGGGVGSTTETEQTTAPESNVFVNADLTGDGFIEINSNDTPEAFGPNVLPFAKVAGSTGLALRKAVTALTPRDPGSLSPSGSGSITLSEASGAFSAYLVEPSDSFYNLLSSVTLTTGEQYSHSVSVENVEGGTLRLQMDGASGENVTAEFSLTDGSVTSSPVATASWSSLSTEVVDEGGGWWRFSIAGQYDGANATSRSFRARTTSAVDWKIRAFQVSEDSLFLGWVGGTLSSAGVSRSEHTCTDTAIVRTAIAACDDVVTQGFRFNLTDIGATQCIYDNGALKVEITSSGTVTVTVGANSFTTTGAISFGTWQRVILTISGTSLRISLNGASSETNTYAAALAMSAITDSRVGRTVGDANKAQGVLSHRVGTDKFGTTGDIEAWNPA